MKRTGVFVSYSHQDKKWLDLLLVHLKFLKQQYQFSIWVDTEIKAGDQWRKEITNAMESARVAILLISANYLASDFIHNEELPSLLTAAEDEGAVILPLILGHCMFMETESLSKFQAINPPDKPLTDMLEGERDALFVRITRETKNAMTLEMPQVKPINIIEKDNNITEDGLRDSLARIAVLMVLNKTDDIFEGYNVSDIYKLSNIKSRKRVYEAVKEMENAMLIEKTKVGKVTFWKLSKKGKKIAEEFYDILLLHVNKK
ncbi:MAG: toll/interleukin-1 receptor domain-containing protein [Saprospiraceae bacterium]|nr:toll/interleukin-1 receptor domain-containing protein [Saprospiraceae bacterium]